MTTKLFERIDFSILFSFKLRYNWDVVVLMQKIVIIGGGAAGLVAAIYAAKSGLEVTLLERNNNVGKKILITGNGRCNYFNDDWDLRHYHSANPEILKQIITEKNLKEIIDFFDQIGIVPKIKNGLYYPNSNQAVSVREALRCECKLNGVKIKNDIYVTKIIKKDKFVINPETDHIVADKIIIATGSKAAFKTGSDGLGYQIAASLGHHVIKPLPALVQLVTKENIKPLSGIRCDVSVSLQEDQKILKTEVGEIQFTDYGASGICIFNLSSLCARGLDQNKKEAVVINLLPTISDFISFMEKRNQKVKGRNLSELFDGLLNYKLADFILQKTNLDKKAKWSNLTLSQKEKLSQNITAFKLEIESTKDFDCAQTCSGGIPLTEINPQTFESLIVKDLYFAGEILDVDGDCGGYNLTFAWLSGMLAGKN